MSSKPKEWMLYGANGFTGALIAREAKRRGMSVILAGRSEAKLKTLAKELSLPYRAFSLNSIDEVKDNISSCSLVLLCAGPFSETSQPMVQACLELGIHYLDITGEIEVLDRVLSLNRTAKERGSILIPGVGFDVVPSDCLAKSLSESLPDSEELILAFRGEASLSPGTTKTMIENLPKGSKVRRQGKLTYIPAFSLFRTIPFAKKPRFCSAIPWGDVASAFYSTQIPNITVYSATPHWSRWMKLPVRALSPVLKQERVQSFLKSQVEKHIKGPSEEHQKKARMELWGEVKRGGTTLQQKLEVPEGYHLTMLTALRSVEKVLAGDVAPGSYTPSMAFGSRFIEEFEGVKRL
ncbi:MAG: saccharopine dehydrogenase family protein [Deltaproteobacteria bacterium]